MDYARQMKKKNISNRNIFERRKRFRNNRELKVLRIKMNSVIMLCYNFYVHFQTPDEDLIINRKYSGNLMVLLVLREVRAWSYNNLNHPTYPMAS